MPITTDAFAEQLVGTLVAQGVVIADESAAASSISTSLTDWMGGEGAVPADLSQKLATAIGNINADQLQRIDWWAGPADGGPNNDGLYPMTNAAGVTTLFPSLAKIFETVGTAGDPAAVVAEVEVLVGAAEAARDQVNTTVAAWSDNQVIGRAVALVNAAGAVAGTRVMAVPAAQNSVAKKMRLYASTAGTVKLRAFTKSGTTFAQVGIDYPVAVSVGEAEYDIAVPLLAGQHIGFYVPTGAQDYVSGVTVDEDDGGYYATTGDSTGFTAAITRTVQLQISFDIQYLAVTKDRVDNVEATANNASAIASANLDKVAVFEGALTQLVTIGRASTPTSTGSGAGNFTYAFNEPLAAGGALEVFEVFVTGSGAASFKLRRFTKAGSIFTQVGADKVLSLDPGLNTVGGEALADWPVSAGEYLGFYAPLNRLSYTTNTSESGGWWAGSGDLTTFTDDTLVTSLRLEAAFHVRERLIPETAALAGRVDAVEDTTATVVGSLALYAKETGVRASNGAVFDPDAGSFYGWGFAADVGADLTADQAIDTITCGLKVATGGVNVRLKVYSRATPSGGTDGVPGASGDTLLGTTTTSLTDLGLTVGAFGPADLPLPTTITPSAGTTLVFEIDALDVSNARIEIGINRANPGTLVQRQKGWYFPSTATAWTAIGAAALAWSLKGARYTLPDLDTRVSALEEGSGASVDLLLAAYPSVAVAALNVTIGGSIHKNASDLATASTIAMPAAASGKERLDLIVADKLTGALSRVAGTERNVDYDAIEYIPVPTAQSAHLATVLVGETTAVAVNVAQFRGLIKVGREGEFAAHVVRNRGILRKVIGKAHRGATIKWGGYGDSITALQDTSLKPATLAAQYVANGSWRDLVAWYFSDYPSDTKALINADRAARGNMGWNWAIKRALDELAGSAVTTYYNYGIGSTTSENSLASSGTLPNGLYPDRIAVPLAEGLDAVTIAFGMNERGQTFTYANIVNMIGQFRAVGTACVVMGVPRPNGRNSVSAWRYTNDALEAAAMDAGAAYVSTVMISDDRNLGGIGAPAECLGATNEATTGHPGNHPGLFEHKQYERAAVLQLGL